MYLDKNGNPTMVPPEQQELVALKCRSWILSRCGKSKEEEWKKLQKEIKNYGNK